MPKSRSRKKWKGPTPKKPRVPLRPMTQTDYNVIQLLRTPKGRRGIKL